MDEIQLDSERANDDQFQGKFWQTPWLSYYTQHWFVFANTVW